MSQFYINKSGSTIRVYNSTDSSRIQIGTLANREAFSEIGSEGDFSANKFLGKNGLANGYLINAPVATFTPCTDYPYESVKIGGTTYKAFKFRRNSNIYTVDGTYWGKVASGRRVACLTALAGSSHPEWKAINYVENTNGGWIEVFDDKLRYGFVDTGLSIGSGPSSISMYGTW